MAIEDRVSTLRQRHAALDEAVRRETARPHPDSARVGDLKRQKLRLKEMLQQLS